MPVIGPADEEAKNSPDMEGREPCSRQLRAAAVENCLMNIGNILRLWRAAAERCIEYTILLRCGATRA